MNGIYDRSFLIEDYYIKASYPRTAINIAVASLGNVIFNALGTKLFHLEPQPASFDRNVFSGRALIRFDKQGDAERFRTLVINNTLNWPDGLLFYPIVYLWPGPEQLPASVLRECKLHVRSTALQGATVGWAHSVLLQLAQFLFVESSKFPVEAERECARLAAVSLQFLPRRSAKHAAMDCLSITLTNPRAKRALLSAQFGEGPVGVVKAPLPTGGTVSFTFCESVYVQSAPFQAYLLPEFFLPLLSQLRSTKEATVTDKDVARANAAALTSIEQETLLLQLAQEWQCTFTDTIVPAIQQFQTAGVRFKHGFPMEPFGLVLTCPDARVYQACTDELGIMLPKTGFLRFTQARQSVFLRVAPDLMQPSPSPPPIRRGTGRAKQLGRGRGKRHYASSSHSGGSESAYTSRDSFEEHYQWDAGHMDYDGSQ